MSFDIVKFERGQVWVIRYKDQTSVGHEIKKDRPWLVLSVGSFNKSSGMITCVPITTRDYAPYPYQVSMKNMRGEDNVILCEQVRTFDYMSGAYQFDYLGNVSAEILEKVDVAISIHLGLHYSPITLKRLYDSMESIIKSVGHMQKEANTPKFTDADVIDFAEKLRMFASTHEEKPMSIISYMNKAYNSPEDNEISATKEESSNNTAEVNSKKQEAGITLTHESIEEVGFKVKRIRWTPEKCKEFLNDDDTLPMEELMEKWGIAKKSRYYAMKNYVKNLLKGVE